MKYEIAYLNLSGSAETMAYGIADHLPMEETIVTDLSYESLAGRADTCIIGFDITKTTIPFKIMDALDEAEGKRLLFCVTCGMKPSENYRAALEKELAPFLPDDCDYQGIFLCRGTFPEEMVDSAKTMLAENPDHPSAKRILQEAEESQGHPNQEDIENACRFIRERLG